MQHLRRCVMDKDTKTELDYLLPDKAYEILK